MDEKVIILYSCSLCKKISGCNRGSCGDCMARNVCSFRLANIKTVIGELCWECESDKMVKEVCYHKPKKTPRPDLSIKGKRKKKRRKK